MKRFDIEFAVGIFLLLGIASLAYLSIKLARLEIGGPPGYELRATFRNCGGLKRGASVAIAGVDVGRVQSIRLADNEALVVFTIDPTVQVQGDAIASIRTKGLIGEKYIEISPGGAEDPLKSGDRIRDTEPAVDFGDLLTKFVHGSVDQKKKNEDK
jgi:phospholipid/cholesterol/gamma-HCH transport system substrate-binding protein